MSEHAVCYINGAKHKISGSQAFLSISDYLRHEKGLTGTKVVCSEGDCGACSILVSRFENGGMTEYKSINSCVSFMYLMHKCHIVTVEGLSKQGHMHQVQERIKEHHGTQCGFCTPGFVCSMAWMAEDLKKNPRPLTAQKVKNYLTGNLCRCTGYQSIIEAGLEVDTNKIEPIDSYFDKAAMESDFLNLNEAVHIQTDQKEVYIPHMFHELIRYKTENTDAKIISGGTDLGVIINKRVAVYNKLISLNQMLDVNNVTLQQHEVEIGAMVTLAQIEQELKSDFPEFCRLLHIFASPQIKNTATLAGNVINASPISDTIPFLMVADARLQLVGAAGTREMNINDFFGKGYKNLNLKQNEIVTKILIPKQHLEFKLYKVSIRKDLDISSVTMAMSYSLKGIKIESIKIAFGGVGPKVLRCKALEKIATGSDFSLKTFEKMIGALENEIGPISDHRGSKEYRTQVCKNLLLKMYDEVRVEGGLGFSGASV